MFLTQKTVRASCFFLGTFQIYLALNHQNSLPKIRLSHLHYLLQTLQWHQSADSIEIKFLNRTRNAFSDLISAYLSVPVYSFTNVSRVTKLLTCFPYALQTYGLSHLFVFLMSLGLQYLFTNIVINNIWTFFFKIIHYSFLCLETFSWPLPTSH